MIGDVDDVVSRSKTGTVSDDEVKEAAARLRSGGDPDAYGLLYVLGRMEATEHRGLVEGFMRQHDDLELARLALRILSVWWGDCGRYLIDVEQFARGVEWDVDEDLQEEAISALGEYLRSASDGKLLELVYRTYLDHAAERLLRETAYSALGRAMGRSYLEIPPASRHFEVPPREEAILLAAVERRLASEIGPRTSRH